MVKLPEILKRVGVAQSVSPSALTPGSVCLLKRQGRELDGSRIAALIESPWAIVGTLIHRAIKLADGRSNILQVFDELVRRREVDLLEDARRRHFVPLRAAIGEGGWSSRLQILLRRKGTGDPMPLARLDAERDVIPSTVQPSHEMWLESEALGLRGSADHIEFVGENVIRITDWKTGSVLNAEGDVHEHYRLQLAAYRMLARERWPGREVETVLFNGETTNVHITASDEELVQRAVSDIRTAIRGRREAAAIDLTLPGQECVDCSIRHRCPAYLPELRGTGRGVSTGPSPTWPGDVLGNVSLVQVRGDTTLLNLVLPTGAQVQMRWSNERIDASGLLGQGVVGFGLLPLARRSRVNGEVLEPLMYEEVGQSRRAWRAEIYCL